MTEYVEMKPLLDKTATVATEYSLNDENFSIQSTRLIQEGTHEEGPVDRCPIQFAITERHQDPLISCNKKVIVALVIAAALAIIFGWIKYIYIKYNKL